MSKIAHAFADAAIAGDPQRDAGPGAMPVARFTTMLLSVPARGRSSWDGAAPPSPCRPGDAVWLLPAPTRSDAGEIAVVLPSREAPIGYLPAWASFLLGPRCGSTGTRATVRSVAYDAGDDSHDPASLLEIVLAPAA